MNHKVFAHQQLRERRKGESQSTLLDYHAVYLLIRGNQAFTTVLEQHPGPESFRDLYTLSRVFLKKVRYHSQKFSKKYMRLMPREGGTYKLLMDEGAQENFVRVDDVDLHEHSFSDNLPTISGSP